MLHASGAPSVLQSGVPVAMSQASTVPFVLQSAPSARSQTSGTPLVLQSVAPPATSQASAWPFVLQSGSHSSGTPLLSQSNDAPCPISQESAMLLVLQSA